MGICDFRGNQENKTEVVLEGNQPDNVKANVNIDADIPVKNDAFDREEKEEREDQNQINDFINNDNSKQITFNNNVQDHDFQYEELKQDENAEDENEKKNLENEDKVPPGGDSKNEENNNIEPTPFDNDHHHGDNESEDEFHCTGNNKVEKLTKIKTDTIKLDHPMKYYHKEKETIMKGFGNMIKKQLENNQ